jgi:hypothetical protein
MGQEPVFAAPQPFSKGVDCFLPQADVAFAQFLNPQPHLVGSHNASDRFVVPFLFEGDFPDALAGDKPTQDPFGLWRRNPGARLFGRVWVGLVGFGRFTFLIFWL